MDYTTLSELKYHLYDDGLKSIADIFCPFGTYALKRSYTIAMGITHRKERHVNQP
ncbi:hypothetical protein V6R21_06475 [Limibacter armeniacum]|uniref:hypothetical protein n=1 Tax=Limibacter armeniacum TaxID=466084 RepID=UPI002FE5E6EA